MRIRSNFLGDGEARAAQTVLLCDVLDLERAPGSGTSVWKPFAFFTPDGRCAATLDAALLPLVVDDATLTTGAIRAVATHPDYRGRGLFKALMTEALRWLGTKGAKLTLLYSAEPAIYSRFGFREVPQHSFLGIAPALSEVEPVRRLRLDNESHCRLIGHIVEGREPVSSRGALQIDTDQYISNLRNDPSLCANHLTNTDALLIFEQNDGDVRIVDFVTSAKPNIAQIVGAVSGAPRKLRTMFAPDRLDWDGQPEPESTGLMIRGVLPPALTAPFMLPPTSEF